MNKKTDIAALFDLDGVIIDSENTYSEIWDRIEKRFPTGVEDFPRVIKGTTLEHILSTYFNDPAVRPQVEKMLLEEENEMVYNYCPGADKFLDTLKKHGIPIALVTSSNSKKMAHLRNCLPELESIFDFIVVGEMVSKSKPDPEGYLLASSRLGVDASRCVVFEDSLQGVKAGKAAGALVVGVVGTLSAETLRPDSDILVENLTEINIEDLMKTLVL